MQVFKTMQGVLGWIVPFDIVFSAYYCAIFCSGKFCVLYNFAFQLAIVGSSVGCISRIHASLRETRPDG